MIDEPDVDRPLVFVGVDPGKHGAIACIYHDPSGASIPRTGLFYTPVDTIRKRRPRKKTKSGKPSYSTTTEYNLLGIAGLVRLWVPATTERTVIIGIERQGQRPLDSKQVVFQVGRGQGIWEMVFSAYAHRYELISPVSWKPKYLPAGADKKASMAVARELYSSFTHTAAKAEALAEALLIADFMRRKTLGLTFPR